MKTITVKYINQLASFLDEQGISFINNGDDTITFSVSSDEQLFELGYYFGLFTATI